jgi:hypothetical protein
MEIGMAKRPLGYLMLGTLALGLAAAPSWAQSGGGSSSGPGGPGTGVGGPASGLGSSADRMGTAPGAGAGGRIGTGIGTLGTTGTPGSGMADPGTGTAPRAPIPGTNIPGDTIQRNCPAGTQWDQQALSCR